MAKSDSHGKQTQDKTTSIQFLKGEGSKTIKTALIHDWFDHYGGAERVLTAISEMFSFDYYYTYANLMQPDTLRIVLAEKKAVVEESAFVKPFKAYFRYLMPLFPLIVKLFNKQTRSNKVDLVISSSWALSKGYRVGNEIHVSYFQARNFKYVWEESDVYFKGVLQLLSFLKYPLRKFDLRTAKNPQYIIANSEFVRDWVKEKYNREAHVIYPPVDVEAFEIAAQKEDYYITVGRLEPYKRFDIVLKAFNLNGRKLMVVGDGSEMRYLKSIAHANITFLGYKKKEDFKKYLSKAKAFVYAGVEDFGIAIVEAFAAGTPVIAFKGGASKELIDPEKKNGILYESQTAESLCKAVESFEESHEEFISESIRKTSLRFSKKRFQQEFSAYIQTIVNTI